VLASVESSAERIDVDQLNQILGILGTPDEETLCRVGSERVSL